MAEFRGEDLTGAVFDDVRLRGAWFRNVDLSGAVVRGAWAETIEISGEVGAMTVNGVDVMPFVESELDRRHPDRATMRVTDADGLREAWAVLERLWDGTVERARRLDPELLHVRVDGEWSFVETLRHLVFATDAWVRRAYLGDPSPWSPLGLPHDDMPEASGVPRDRAMRPSLDEVLAVRAGRVSTMRDVLADLTDEELAGSTSAVTEPGYPESKTFPVRRVLGAILNEEWEHRLFAERDLAVLESRHG